MLNKVDMRSPTYRNKLNSRPEPLCYGTGKEPFHFNILNKQDEPRPFKNTDSPIPQIVNDDFIEELCRSSLITSPIIERVFHAVDYTDYLFPSYIEYEYEGLPWRCNHLHISSPSFYAKVMNELALKPGLSFLNLGSGTGYLSTMVGLVLGSNGINHGVELNKDVVNYAKKKLETFKIYSGSIAEFDFCEPTFMQGNCLCLKSDRKYDRIYVGANCRQRYREYFEDFLSEGGILLMIVNGTFRRIRRLEKYKFSKIKLFNEPCARLISPKRNERVLELMKVKIPSLQIKCCSLIRNTLRRNIDMEMPNLKNRYLYKNIKHKVQQREEVETIYFKSCMGEKDTCTINDSEDEDESSTTSDNETDKDFSSLSQTIGICNSPYSELMTNKIMLLPLPPGLKDFLNYKYLTF